MPYFGDIFIPWLTDNDTSVSKDIVEKNFVDKPPQVYELTANLEAGTYSVILNEDASEKDESFEVQQDAVLSMVSRHGTEFPVQFSSDDGYVLVESANVTNLPNLSIREGEIELRFLERDSYYSAVKALPRERTGGEFGDDATPVSSLIAFPEGANVVGEFPDYQVESEDGDVHLHKFAQEKIFEIEESADITLSQSNAICRLFDSFDDRIYSDNRVADVGSKSENALISVTYDETQSDVEFFRGSWRPLGSASLPCDDGYAAVNTNDEVTVEFVNENTTSVYRGFSAVRYGFTDESTFTFSPANSSSNISTHSYYAHWEDVNGNDIIIVRFSDDGSFYWGSSGFGVANLDINDRYSVFVAVVPDDIPVEDYARYLYNFGQRERTFTHK